MQSYDMMKWIQYLFRLKWKILLLNHTKWVLISLF